MSATARADGHEDGELHRDAVVGGPQPSLEEVQAADVGRPDQATPEPDHQHGQGQSGPDVDDLVRQPMTGISRPHINIVTRYICAAAKRVGSVMRLADRSERSAGASA